MIKVETRFTVLFEDPFWVGVFERVEEGKLTVAKHTFGAEPSMAEIYGAVISWVNDNGYECAEPMFNIYHVSPHETQNPDEFVTEVCYAVK